MSVNDEERLHFEEITNTFRFYGEHTRRWMEHKQSDFNKLPQHYQDLLEPQFSQRMGEMASAATVNANFLSKIVAPQAPLFVNSELGNEEERKVPEASEFNMQKLQSTLRQFVRDWSEEGAAERKQCYDPLIEELMRLKPVTADDDQLLKVLIPGCGLSRLAFDIARLGYSCTGNEFSFFMLLASNWMLNNCSSAFSETIYPFIHQVSNVKHSSEAFRPVSIPDVCPGDFAEVLMQRQFSMAAGDFIDVFGDSSQLGQWDAIITCFFVDTAHNIVKYLEIIRDALKPDGVWINLGPLLFHFEDNPSEESIELPFDHLRLIIEQVGFEFLREPETKPVTYAANAQSMLQSVYHCEFFSCKRKMLNE